MATRQEGIRSDPQPPLPTGPPTPLDSWDRHCVLCSRCCLKCVIILNTPRLLVRHLSACRRCHVSQSVSRRDTTMDKPPPKLCFDNLRSWKDYRVSGLHSSQKQQEVVAASINCLHGKPPARCDRIHYILIELLLPFFPTPMKLNLCGFDIIMRTHKCRKNKNMSHGVVVAVRHDKDRINHIDMSDWRLVPSMSYDQRQVCLLDWRNGGKAQQKWSGGAGKWLRMWFMHYKTCVALNWICWRFCAIPN